MKVYNPYATQLTFPNHKTRMRRDHLKYLNLISTVLLHQTQRVIHDIDGDESISVDTVTSRQPTDWLAKSSVNHSMNYHRKRAAYSA